MTDHDDGSDPALDGLTRAIAAWTDEHPVVLGYVLVAAFLDGDGDRRVFCDTFEDQRAHETLGLLDFAATHERARITREVLNEADGDDND